MGVYNKLARHLLLGFMADNLVKQFNHLENVKHIYDQVIRKYDLSPTSHLAEAFSANINYKMLERTFIRKHIDQMTVKVRNLAALARDIDQDP